MNCCYTGVLCGSFDEIRSLILENSVTLKVDSRTAEKLSYQASLTNSAHNFKQMFLILLRHCASTTCILIDRSEVIKDGQMNDNPRAQNQLLV